MNSRQPWTPAEDQILISLVNKFGVGNWTIISQKMEARPNTNFRSGKQCRQRWHNHLDPKVQKKSWTLQEQKVMFEAHKKYGNKWTDIANQLHNRTDSDVKNHFYSIIRKSLRRLSKMVGQKNSTEKIRNLKPSILSKLLEKNNDAQSKETSDALFKFILQRQNLNFQTLEKKSRDLLEKLVDNIAKMNDEKDRPVNSLCLDDNPSDERDNKIKKKPEIFKRSSRILRSSLQIEGSEKDTEKTVKVSNKKKVPKVKKIKKKPSLKINKRGSQLSTIGKQNIANESSVPNERIEIEIPIIVKNPSIRLQSMISDHNSDGFRQFETGYDLRRRSSRSRESILSDRGFVHEINISEISNTRRSSASYDNRRMMSSTTENFMNFCMTPPMPSPGFGGNLFETFSKQINTGSLTLGELNSEVDILKKTIWKNNQSL